MAMKWLPALCADRLLHALEEILLVDVGFERAAGFAGDDEESLREIDFFSTLLICAGSVESRMCSRGKPGACGKVSDKTSGHKAGPAHAQQQDIGESGGLNFVCEIFQLRRIRKLLVGDRQPTEPLAFVLIGPQGSIVLPETPYFSRGAPVIKVFFYGRVRSAGSVAVCALTCGVAGRCVFFSTAASSLSKASANSFTPSAVSLSVTSFMTMPTDGESAMVFCAPSTSSVRLWRGLP